MTQPLDLVLHQANDHFSRKRPKTAALHERAKAVMPGGNTRTILHSAPFPIRVEKASGAVVTDVDGHDYVDFLGEYSAGLYGHSHPRIHAAVAEALAIGLNIGASHEREVAFAETVCRRFGLDLVRFTNSGTEANMMAIAAARCFTGRPKLMVMHGGYHGGTLYFSHGPSPVNAPYDVVIAPFNDIEGTRALIGKHAGELGSIIIEPMLGGGGCLPADRAFLEMLRAATEARGIVLIFDEVMCSRLHPGGLSAALGIAPDLKTYGKYIGGGMSFGAFGGKAEIMGQFDPSRPDALPHAGTYNNNTLTMTVGQVAMTEIFTPEACVALNARGDRLRGRLNDLFMSYQAPMRATGIGSLLAVHPLAGPVARPEDAQRADPRARHLLFLDLLDRGYYIAERGYLALSLAVTEAHCEGLVEAVESFIRERREIMQP